MDRFKNILVDLTECDHKKVALHRFVSLAERNLGRITLFTSIDEPNLMAKVSTGFSGLVEKYTRVIKADSIQGLRDLADTYKTEGVQPEVAVRGGTAAIATVQFALENDCDLIVVPLPEGGTLNTSYAKKIIRKSACPVWIGHSKPLDSVAVCVDPHGVEGTQLELNQTSLEMASTLAAMEGVPLHIVSAWSPLSTHQIGRFTSNGEIREYQEGAQKITEDALEGLLDGFWGLGCHIEVHLEKGSAVDVIPEVVNRVGADLVVMGNLARTGISGYLIGNTAEQVMDEINCSLLTMKSREFISPVSTNK